MLVAYLTVVIILLLLSMVAMYHVYRPAEEGFRRGRGRYRGYGAGGYRGLYNPYVYSSYYNPYYDSTASTVIIKESPSDFAKMTKEEWEYLYLPDNLKKKKEKPAEKNTTTKPPTDKPPTDKPPAEEPGKAPNN